MLCNNIKGNDSLGASASVTLGIAHRCQQEVKHPGGSKQRKQGSPYQEPIAAVQANYFCTQAVQSAQMSVDGWSENTTNSRAAAIDAAKDASESAQMCHKFMRNIQAKA